MKDPKLEELRRAVEASRTVVKSQIRSLRTCLSFLTDLDERLAELEEDRKARGGTARDDTDEDEATVG